MDGGQAFPRAEGECTQAVNGMTLRDWFAGMAMIGVLASDQRVDGDKSLPDITYMDCAIEAYLYADSMLAERAKEQP